MPNKSREHKEFPIGTKIGKWTVVGTMQLKKHNRWVHKVECECGNKGLVVYNKLAIGESLSCGCMYGRKHSQKDFPEDLSDKERVVKAKIVSSVKGKAAIKRDLDMGGLATSLTIEGVPFREWLKDKI
jgi:hypothetical protein